MGDEEGPQCKVEYTDVAEGAEEVTNWIRRAGTAKVTYVNGCTYTGTFDSERIKQGAGVYVWMGPGAEEDSVVEKARYEGNYKDGLKSGFGRMVYPNGDVYEGMWFENKMQGEGTYSYKKSGDIYSGSFVDGKKHGQGRYEFMADLSMLVGTWVEGEISTGNWELKGAAVYSGDFKLGRPFGAGKFAFASGLSQTGSYDVAKVPGEEEEQPAEGEAPKPPNVKWNGDIITAF